MNNFGKLFLEVVSVFGKNRYPVDPQSTRTTDRPQLNINEAILISAAPKSNRLAYLSLISPTYSLVNAFHVSEFRTCR